jgi:hypothetical protein
MRDPAREVTEDWRAYFDKPAEEYESFDATIEIVSAELGDQAEVERMPLKYLAYDDKDEAFIVAVGGRDGRYPVLLRHIVQNPQKIMADEFSHNPVMAVSVIGPDETQTLVTLYRRPALPPPRS